MDVAAADGLGITGPYPETYSFTTPKDSLKAADVGVSGAGNLVYDGTSKVPNIFVTLNGEAVLPNAYDLIFTRADGTVGDTVNAGTVTVTVTAKEGGAYTGTADIHQTYVIDRAAPTFGWVPASSLPYSGAAADIPPAAVELQNAETYHGTVHYAYRVSTFTGDFTPSLPTDAGVYTVRASVDEMPNYTAASAEMTLTVDKATPVISFDLNKYTDSRDYNGSPMSLPTPTQLTVTGADVGEVTFTWYARTSPSDTALTQPPTHAGGYWLELSVPDASNHSTAEASTNVTIAPARIDITGTVTGSYTYTGSEIKPTPVLTFGGGKILPAEEYTLSYFNNTGAGTATVTARAADNGNYQFAPVQVPFTIDKAPQAAFTVTGAPSAAPIYGAAFALTAAGGTGTGNVTWSVTSGGENATVDATVDADTGLVTITGVGPVSVTAVKAGGDNYLNATAVSSFTTQKTVPTPGTVSYTGGRSTIP